MTELMPLEAAEEALDEAFDEMEGEDMHYLPDQFMPSEYVLLAKGFRGSGKSIYEVYCLLNSLLLNIPVFSNLTFKNEVLAKELEITAFPKPFDLSQIFSFDKGLSGAVIAIDEITSMFDKLRTSTNQNLFMQGALQQLRKRNWIFILTCQFGNYLPYGLSDQVDLEVYCQDAFFTPWGRKRNLGKGDTFLYTIEDRSGLFTGGYQPPFTYAIPGCSALWQFYDTYQTQDPYAVSQKWKVDGMQERMVGEEGAYPEYESSTADDERKLRQYRGLLSNIWKQAFIGWVLDNQERTGYRDKGSTITLSPLRIEQSLAQMKGGVQKRAIETGYKKILGEAERGIIAKRHADTISVMKLSALADDTVTPLDPSEHTEFGFERVS